MRIPGFVCFVAAISLGGCSSRSGSNPNLLAGTFTAQSGPTAAIRDALPSSYKIGPLDELKIVVFKEPDLSSEDLPVDLGGTISLPLIGQFQASGTTAAELGQLITARLNSEYLRNAQVAVSVTKPVNYSFTVDGEVEKPGVYAIPGKLTLLQAIALGEGATEFAKKGDVVIFRDIDGQRHAARFDLREIRTASAPDPVILQGDVVVVGYSSSSRFGRDLVLALPGLAGVFVALVRR